MAVQKLSTDALNRKRFIEAQAMDWFLCERKVRVSFHLSIGGLGLFRSEVERFLLLGSRGEFRKVD